MKAVCNQSAGPVALFYACVFVVDGRPTLLPLQILILNFYIDKDLRHACFIFRA